METEVLRVSLFVLPELGAVFEKVEKSFGEVKHKKLKDIQNRNKIKMITKNSLFRKKLTT